MKNKGRWQMALKKPSAPLLFVITVGVAISPVEKLVGKINSNSTSVHKACRTTKHEPGV
jgi:hypothetical protein